jgi:hypothetical protein
MIPKESHIGELAGESLSAVSFVHDYLEFRFDEKIVRAYSAPVMGDRDRVVTPTAPGWRDALCSLIEGFVLSVRLPTKENQFIEVFFSDGRKLLLPISEQGPEAVHYVAGENRPIEVW